MVKTEDDVDRGGESVMHVFLYNGRDGTGAATSRKQLRLGLRAAVTAVIDSTCYLYSPISTPALSSRFNSTLLQLLEHRFYISRLPLFPFFQPSSTCNVQFFRVCMCMEVEHEKWNFFWWKKWLIKKEKYRSILIKYSLKCILFLFIVRVKWM